MARNWALAAATLILLSGCGLNTPPSEARVRAPEFVGGKADWINTSPITLKEILRTHKTPDGKPVAAILVDFWEYTCINCIRTMPYLKEWNKRYSDKGLLIVGIHTPEFGFAHDGKHVAEAVKRFGLTYPILVDSDHRNWDAYSNQYWPRHYLIDSRGYIVSDHAGEGGYSETEREIQSLLKRYDPGVALPKVMDVVRETDRPDAVCYPVTGETYVGYERGQLGNRGGYRRDVAADYADTGRYEDGVPVAVGSWRATPEALIHTSTRPDDAILLRYHALDLYAVIKPEGGTPLRVYVTQDGKPLPVADKGADILFDEQGRPYLNVDSPRMYAIAHNAKFGQHVLGLSSPSSGFGLYSYTFGSCTE
ncbi:MAG TPA: redoxin family protein [Armatimonadota bacterium]|jgi:thiol-disulfide isomerase/thioredoxin